MNTLRVSVSSMDRSGFSERSETRLNGAKICAGVTSPPLKWLSNKYGAAHVRRGFTFEAMFDLANKPLSPVTRRCCCHSVAILLMTERGVLLHTLVLH